MDCREFTTPRGWKIVKTESRVVQPFVPGNTVWIAEPSEDSYTVTVFEQEELKGRYPGFRCSGERLEGRAEDEALSMSIVSRLLIGAWGPTDTAGTWVGDEGGGGGGSEDV